MKKQLTLVSYDHEHHRLLNTPCSPREKINKNLGEQGKGNPGKYRKKPESPSYFTYSFFFFFLIEEKTIPAIMTKTTTRRINPSIVFTPL
jgi:hypothetical protein